MGQEAVRKIYTDFSKQLFDEEKMQKAVLAIRNEKKNKKNENAPQYRKA